jgi:hypothetical protein
MEQSLHQENQKQNDSVFVISSAIHAKHGIYSSEERLKQTIETCKSVLARAPVDIIILDGGYKQLSQEEQKEIESYITVFYSFADAMNVQEIQKIDNWDIVKNMIELIMFGSFFDERKNDLSNRYKRIFKMSGRYQLTDNFNHALHMDATDKIIIRGPYTSQFTPEITGGVKLQFMSRLWSFDSKLTEYVSEAYKNMFMNMVERLNSKGYIDIEHLLFKHLDPKLIQYIDKIGVCGNIAPNGMFVEE